MKSIGKKITNTFEIKVDRDIKSHSSDPFVLKKLEEAKKVLKGLKNKTSY
ncbi:hypothetical protein [Dyadobacter sp. NIV53]|nr:hypothetical protein [Dyadobacter sp. NIV53]